MRGGNARSDGEGMRGVPWEQCLVEVKARSEGRESGDEMRCEESAELRLWAEGSGLVVVSLLGQGRAGEGRAAVNDVRKVMDWNLKVMP